MKILRASVLLFSMLVVSPAWSASDMEELAQLIEGTFDTHALDPGLPPEQRLVDRRIRLNVPGLGGYVFYQQINHRENLEVYRQRILVLGISEESGRIEQRAYALREPEWYVDADADVFTTLRMDNLDKFMADGCEQVWTRMGKGFRGYVDPKRCQVTSTRTGKLRSIEAENYLDADSVSLVERGYDPDTGEQLFGSPPGEASLLGRAH